MVVVVLEVIVSVLILALVVASSRSPLEFTLR